jgi:hypothetical protein
MDPETVQGILDAIASAWRLDKDAEITLEANPTSVEAGRFRGYRSAGVNRLSIGVQALARRCSTPWSPTSRHRQFYLLPSWVCNLMMPAT